MNYKLTITLAILIGLYGCQQEPEQAVVTPQAEPEAVSTVEEAVAATTELTSGIDQSEFSDTVRPQDDFFDYVNGNWVANTEMPADRARWGTFDALREQSDKDVRNLVEEVSAKQDVENGSPTQKIRDFYNSYMDIETSTKLGAEAIASELAEIQAAGSLDDIYRLLSTLGIYGVNSPIGGYIFSDEKDPDTNVVYVAQAGLTMPDRDYYLKDDEQFVKGRQLYLDYVTNVFTKAGI